MKSFTKFIRSIVVALFAPVAAYAETYLLAYAVVNVKSLPLTNADGNPAKINSASVDRARILSARGVVAVANGDSIASIFRMFRVRSGDMMQSLLIDSDAITSAAADIGLYRKTSEGGAVVDADFFASAHSIATAQRSADVLRESGIVTVANMERPIWQALGLSADPNLEYDVALTLTAAATAAGSVCLRGEFNGTF